MKYLLSAFIVFIFIGCDSDKLSETPISQFVGTWKLSGRSMYQDVEIKIVMKNNKLTGVISKLNSNKFVNLFIKENDLFIAEIKRTSNFQFILKEKKIASELFASYGNSTTHEYKVVFENKNTILLGEKGSGGKYTRIN